jgi:flagellin
VKGFNVTIGVLAGATGVTGDGATVSSSEVAGGVTADISTQTSAQNAVNALADAVIVLGQAQAVVGKGQNQFTYAVSLASTQLTNLAASESRIRDADLAYEAANLTKAQILQQAGIAAMAQANSAPQAILSLLRG